MQSIGPTELILVLVIVLILFGPGKLTGMGSSLGKSLREFRKATQDPEPKEEETPVKAEAKVIEAPAASADDRQEIRRPTVTMDEEPASAVPSAESESKRSS